MLITRAASSPGAPRFPASIDVNPTAKCNLKCTFCWGPDHELDDTMGTDAWIELLRYFRAGGTRRVVFTGGEPLLRRDIGTLLREAFTLGYRVTLSTNALLLGRKLKSVVPWIHEVGLPLDGPSAQANAVMRRGRLGHLSYDAVLDGMRIVRGENESVEVTVRTVVSRQNHRSLMAIAEILESRSWLWDRWKLYQFVSASIGELHRDEHELEPGTFEDAVEGVLRRMPDSRVKIQRASTRTGRYLFVGPQGEIFVPAGSSGYRRIGAWDALQKDGVRFMQSLWTHVDYDKNISHG